MFAAFEGRDLLRNRKSSTIQGMRHQVVFVLAMEVGEEVQIFREDQPLLLAELIELVRVLHSLVTLLDFADFPAQPAGESLFEFNLRSTAIEIVDGLAFCGEWNKAAGRILVAKLAGYKPHQQTLAA